MQETDLPGRLKDQMEWYSKKATSQMRWYQTFKFLQILFGFSIPVCSLVASAEQARVVNGILGSAIAAIESYLQFGNLDKNWHRWRSTSEALKRERSLYLQKAGPYADPNAPKQAPSVLAERVEEIIAREHEAWVALVSKTETGASGPEEKKQS